jgi:retron-type reverse transcriptase
MPTRTFPGDHRGAAVPDSSIVPEKPANKDGVPPSAESAEGRGLTKENARQLLLDNIDHSWLLKFLERPTYRSVPIADRRLLRLLKKWLRAGVSEDGEWSPTTVGTPQGAVISPFLANVFLHYVLDLWLDSWRKRHATGEVIIVRYADDFVIGFREESDAKRCLAALRERFTKFGLELHPEKTRLNLFDQEAAQQAL